jgi:hypothetical protein
MESRYSFGGSIKAEDIDEFLDILCEYGVGKVNSFFCNTETDVLAAHQGCSHLEAQIYSGRKDTEGAIVVTYEFDSESFENLLLERFELDFDLIARFDGKEYRCYYRNGEFFDEDNPAEEISELDPIKVIFKHDTIKITENELITV